MFPSRELAEQLLSEALLHNPGPWGDHSRTAAHCAETIAQRCHDMDAQKAYVLGLLHDIGRRFGVRHLGHVSDGYSYMLELGYDEVARICLTHSFYNLTVNDYLGRFDTTEQELALIQNALTGIVPDDYDRLIQLCDALSAATGVVDMEERMLDIRSRYGTYPQAMWEHNLQLRQYFEEKAGGNIYEITEKDTYKP